MSKLRYLSEAITLSLDAEKCNGCGVCVDVCPHAVFVIDNRKAVLVDRDACMECGACSQNCPTEALTVNSGVGCATAILAGSLRGSEPDCGGQAESCCG